MKLLIVLLLVAVTFAESIDLNNINYESFESRFPSIHEVWSPAGGRITNGQSAVPNQLPYQVALYLSIQDKTYFCGGTLISNQWILTAAHCTQGASSITIVLGTVNSNGSGGIVQTTTTYFVHENYNKPSQLANDISLVKLNAPVALSSAIKPASLPASSPTPPLYVGNIAVTSGWGRVATNSTTISPTLQYINVPVISNADCQKVFGSLIIDSMICIGTSPKNTSTCFGDSGGPLVESNTVIGVTSFVASAGCELGFPAGYTRVTSFLNWIFNISGIVF